MLPEPDTEAILKNFLSFTPTKTLAIRYGVDITTVKRILRDILGDADYLKTAHRIGAKIIIRRLKSDPDYRKIYVDNMKRSVRHSLSLKMKNSAFRKKWSLKAFKASKKGNERIEKLLHDADFLRKWEAKCRRGGQKSVSSNLGIHNPRNAKKRVYWSLKGLKNTCRKKRGPRGERMYNILETRVARILCLHSIDYKYEKIFKTDNKNGFLSVDFFINETTPIVIEATYWDDFREKAERISKKFNLLKRLIPNMRFILVTKPSMVHKYKAILPNTILVLDAYGLEQKIAGSGVSILLPVS